MVIENEVRDLRNELEHATTAFLQKFAAQEKWLEKLEASTQETKSSLSHLYQVACQRLDALENLAEKIVAMDRTNKKNLQAVFENQDEIDKQLLLKIKALELQVKGLDKREDQAMKITDKLVEHMGVVLEAIQGENP